MIRGRKNAGRGHGGEQDKKVKPDGVEGGESIVWEYEVGSR